MLITDAIQRFSVYLAAAGRAAKTIRSYEERLQRFQRFGQKASVEDVTADDLECMWSIYANCFRLPV